MARIAFTRNRAVYVIASALVRSLFPVRRKCALAEARKILVIGSGGVGDIVMKTPLFDYLRRAFPQAEITFFTSSGPECRIIQGHPSIDRIVTLAGREGLTPRHLGQVFEWHRKLRAERFDMVLTTHQGVRFRGAFFSYLLGAPIRVGFDKGGRGALHNYRVPVRDADDRHATDWNLDLARAIGIKVEKAELTIALSSEDRAFASAFLRERRADEDVLLAGIFPGSKRISRLWPADRFAAVADALSDRYRARVILLGGERERGIVEAIKGAMHHEPIIAIGQDIRQTAALIERCGLMISTDSGPMHVAVAVKTPVVALFGPETPVRVRPYTERAAVVMHPTPCSPCHDYGCRLGTMACMDAISVEDVLRAVEANSISWGLERWRPTAAR
ncbi:MAG TPA: lipopolysaccharide heptosyltransferase II [bacterium]|nr:lipopolysaccharide heptosyltransferase II [bacterium]